MIQPHNKSIALSKTHVCCAATVQFWTSLETMHLDHRSPRKINKLGFGLHFTSFQFFCGVFLGLVQHSIQFGRVERFNGLLSGLKSLALFGCEQIDSRFAASSAASLKARELAFLPSINNWYSRLASPPRSTSSCSVTVEIQTFASPSSNRFATNLWKLRRVSLLPYKFTICSNLSLACWAETRPSWSATRAGQGVDSPILCNNLESLYWTSRPLATTGCNDEYRCSTSWRFDGLPESFWLRKADWISAARRWAKASNASFRRTEAS